MKRSIALLMLFFFLDLTFLLLAIGEYRRSIPTQKAGGYFGICESDFANIVSELLVADFPHVVTALISFYTGTAGLLTRE